MPLLPSARTVPRNSSYITIRVDLANSMVECIGYIDVSIVVDCQTTGSEEPCRSSGTILPASRTFGSYVIPASRESCNFAGRSYFPYAMIPAVADVKVSGFVDTDSSRIIELRIFTCSVFKSRLTRTRDCSYGTVPCNFSNNVIHKIGNENISLVVGAYTGRLIKQSISCRAVQITGLTCAG